METLHFRSWWSEGKAVPVATASNPSYSTHVLDVFFELGTGAFKVNTSWLPRGWFLCMTDSICCPHTVCAVLFMSVGCFGR